MRITFVIARFAPFLGGAEEYTFSLAKEAVKAGHQVKVLTTNIAPNNAILAKTEILEGIEVLRVNAWNQQLNLGFYPGLLGTLWKEKTDVIHVTNGPGFFWRDFCITVKRLKQIFSSHKIKFITTPHGPFLSTVNTHHGLKKYVGIIGKIVLTPYFWLVWRNLFDLFLQVNPNQYKWLMSEYKVSKRRIGYVPNGIEISDIPETMPEKETNVVGISFVARWEYYKGVLDLITLAAELKKQILHRPFKILIMGRPGPASEDMQKMIKQLDVIDVVELIPSPSDEVRNQILSSRSHINILPSEFEATGIALLWAMAYGNAIITTYQNEAWQSLIEPGINGEVFNYQDTSTLTLLVTEMINSTEKLASMQQQSFERRYNFTWQKSYKLYAEYLN